MLGRATRNFPDGKSVVWANRLRPTGATCPTSGSTDLTSSSTCSTSARRTGSPGLPARRCTRHVGATCTSRSHPFPAMHEVVGHQSPPFRAADRATSRDDAGAARSPSPTHRSCGSVSARPSRTGSAPHLAADVPAVFVAVGAAFDFVAGHKQQAPAVDAAQRAGVGPPARQRAPTAVAALPVRQHPVRVRRRPRRARLPRLGRADRPACTRTTRRGSRVVRTSRSTRRPRCCAGRVTRSRSWRATPTSEEQSRLYPVRSGPSVASGRGAEPGAGAAWVPPDVVHVHNLFPNWGTRWLGEWSGPVVGDPAQLPPAVRRRNPVP